MDAHERRQRLLERLCRERHDTYKNLAQLFGVSKRTIQNDIMVLTGSYPSVKYRRIENKKQRGLLNSRR